MASAIEPAKVLAVLPELVRNGSVSNAEAVLYRIRHERPGFPLDKLTHLGVSSESDVQSVFARVESSYEDLVGVSGRQGGSDA